MWKRLWFVVAAVSLFGLILFVQAYLETPESVLARADRALRRGDAPGAYRLLADYGSLHPADERTGYATALAAFRSGRFSLAMRHLWSLLEVAPSHAQGQELWKRLEAVLHSEVPVVTLDLLEAYDTRLPAPTSADVDEILAEFVAVVDEKFPGGQRISLRRGGVVSPIELFAESSYRDSFEYQQWNPSRYSYQLKAETPGFLTPAARAARIEFLKTWPISSLSDFFRGQKISTYEDAEAALMKTYVQKIDSLLSLRTLAGSPLLISPPKPFQSYIDWLSWIEVQSRCDILVTNSLVVLDSYLMPSPHSVTKHAKIGGFAAFSPLRTALDGRAIMVNAFEEYCGVPGICRTDPSVSRSRKNKILGAVFLAHEFGHAYYGIPDHYDHPEQCLMNSSFHTFDNEIAYLALLKNKGPCPQCLPWLRQRMAWNEARRAQMVLDGSKASEQYRRLLRTFPPGEGPSVYPFRSKVIEEARAWFDLVGDGEGQRLALSLDP